jgi:hypothetical protein
VASVPFGMERICLNLLPHGVKLFVKAHVNGFPHDFGCRRMAAVSSRRNGRPSHAAGRWARSSHNGFEVVEGGANVCLKLR